MNSFINALESIIPSRTFNGTYIIIDLIFLAILVFLVIYKKKYITTMWAAFGGLLYLAVDFGIFYCATKTRVITINGETLDMLGHFLVLLWFSFSYGVPNFIFIWLCFRKDKDLLFFSLLIFGYWIIAPSLSQFGNMDCFKDTFLSATITTARTTQNFHWVMSAFLAVGYGALIIYYIVTKKGNFKENMRILLLLNLVGILTQFSWEFALLINQVRPWNDAAIPTLLINSLIETNSGMPYFMCVFIFINKHFAEDLSFKPNPKDPITVFPKEYEAIRRGDIKSATK